MTKLTPTTSNVAMVGKKLTPHSLVDRMPSADVASKVGGPSVPTIGAARRVVRLGA